VRRDKTLRAIFAGGGTGGHLYPALAIAQALEARQGASNCKFIFVGTKRGIEYRLRETLGYPLELIDVRGMLRKLHWRNAFFPFMLAKALWQSNRLMQSFKPDIVVGTGGYVSGPIVSRAVANHIPTAIQEQNSYPGFTTRRLAGKVDRVYLGFDDARKRLPDGLSALTTGNPVRAEIGTADRAEALRSFGLDPQKETILVLGGSQGARSINKAVLNSLESLSSDRQLLWQTGRDKYDSILESVGSKSHVRLFAFSDKIELAYAAADVALTRAGALTIAELIASVTPAILIPYPFATANHQFENAQSVASRDAALIVCDADLENTNVIERAQQMLESGEARQMRDSLQSWKSATDLSASEMIANDLLELVSWGDQS
jgi:UDP-N-acetylglucosamine--N-acetylmuramyl-(pentapeptide) pyrophosphoryl-undecaprenol N-acetylglucosamine transferase